MARNHSGILTVITPREIGAPLLLLYIGGAKSPVGLGRLPKVP
jgi:hypothetical protein